MAGKSTYMRQVALIVLLAHVGSFVPAAYANISITDRIFTRIGASDDLNSGQSTFMVEMSEMANILTHASSKSLVLLDEVGRGTSTFDGMSIAKAAAIYLVKKAQASGDADFANRTPVLCRIESAKFKGMVFPGDEIIIDVKDGETLAGFYYLSSNVRCNGKIVLQIKFALAMIEKK